MVNPALEVVINEERKIKERIDREQRKAAEWLAREKGRISRETRERTAALEDHCRTATEEAEAAASREVAPEVLQARAYQERLRDLPDQTLIQYLKKHLPGIMPEEGS